MVLFALFQQHTVVKFMVAGGADISSASICTSREYKIARDAYMAVVKNTKILFTKVCKAMMVIAPLCSGKQVVFE